MTTPIKERPILMQGEMVRATLDHRKTKTRRTRGLVEINQTPDEWKLLTSAVLGARFAATFTRKSELRTIFCPYGRVGDRLWVRETWRPCHVPQHNDPSSCVEYAASDYCKAGHLATLKRTGWKPSIHMPRWAARLHLEITSLAIERVQDISEADARREGVARFEGPVEGVFLFQDYSKAGWDVPVHTARESFRTLICSINGDAIWTRNEWCWVIGFKVVGQ